MYISDSLVHRSLALLTHLNVVAVEVILNGKKINIVSLYIPPGEDNFSISDVRSLFVEVLAHGPFVLLGDLNAHHPLWGSSHESGRGTEIDALLTDFNLVCLNDGSPTYLSSTYRTFSSIDLAIVTPLLASWFQFTVEDDPQFSDHFPFKLHPTFRQPLLPPPMVPSWSLKRADWDKFREAVDQASDEMTSPEITTLLAIISEAAAMSIPVSHPSRRKRASPWWTPECAHAVAKRKRALREFQKFLSGETHSQYLSASRYCRAVLRRAKKASWRAFISTFKHSTPLSHIWKIIKSFTNKRDPVCAYPHLTADGTTISDPDQVVQVFADHFERASSDQNYSNAQLNRFRDLSGKCNFTLSSVEDYNHPFTMTELTGAISKLGHTSVGPDGIHYDFFRHMSSSSLDNLLACFNNAWENGEFPDEWLQAYVVPILKTGKPRHLPTSYRPISLTSCASKLFEKLVNVRLSYFLEANSILDPFQSGFRRGRSTAENVLRLTDSIHRGFERKESTVAVFLDLTTAYDRVHPSALFVFFCANDRHSW